MGAFGSGSTSSSMSNTLAILAVAVAILYVAWRNGQIQQETKQLRTLVDASVSFHELEDQVMPAIASLEQEALRVKRDMQLLMRRTGPSRRGRSEQKQAVLDEPLQVESSVEDDYHHLSTDDKDSQGGASLPSDFYHHLSTDDKDSRGGASLPTDFSLLMGMQTILGGLSTSVNVVGVPTTRVVIGSPPLTPSLGPTVTEVSLDDSEDQSDCEYEVSDSERSRGVKRALTASHWE